MSKYEPTIGLEIHAELATKTKMFCDSLNDPDEKHPNTNVCPVCMGHPGTLPVPNKQAIELVIKVGLALGGKIPPVTKFDRKNYFYPDLPKGYQISQYDTPLVSGGSLAGVRITRVHLEEDAGSLQHVTIDKEQLTNGRGSNVKGQMSDVTTVDYNRAGVPLMELVTEPDMHSAETAVRFAKELQLLLRYLGVSHANMEKGHMRVEVNLSMAEAGTKKLGTKVEVKNINSFKAVEGAIAYEIKRQTDLLEDGKGDLIKQETRGWDDVKCITVSQRSKEEAHDYRYFPEPDIPTFPTDVFDLQALKESLPELPAEKRPRFVKEYGLSEAQAALLVDEKMLADYFEGAVSELEELAPDAPTLTLFNYLTSDLKGLINEHGEGFETLKVSPENLAHLVSFIHAEKVTSRQAKDMLREMYINGMDPEDLLAASGGIASDESLKQVVEEVLNENAKAAEDLRGGKMASLQFLIGQAMKKTKGSAKPDILKALFMAKIGG